MYVSHASLNKWKFSSLFLDTVSLMDQSFCPPTWVPQMIDRPQL